MDSVSEYWNKVIVPNKEAFEEEPTYRNAWNYCVSLYHVTDWLAGDRAKQKDLIDRLKTQHTEFVLLQDICDTSKHFSLTTRTRMVTEAQQIELIPPAFQTSAFQSNAFQSESFFLVDEKYSLAAILAKCFQVLEKEVV